MKILAFLTALLFLSACQDNDISVPQPEPNLLIGEWRCVGGLIDGEIAVPGVREMEFTEDSVGITFGDPLWPFGWETDWFEYRTPTQDSLLIDENGLGEMRCRMKVRAEDLWTEEDGVELFFERPY